jgi:hypothetical protein
MKTMVKEKAFSLGAEDSCWGESDLQISPSPTLKLTTWSDFPLLTETHPFEENKEEYCSQAQDSETTSSTIDTIPKSPQHMSPPLTHSSSTTLIPKSKRKNTLSNKSVSFSSLEIRSYEVTLGDHPCSSFPLSLSWKHSSESTLTIDTYEELKRGIRRHGNELRLTIYERMCALNLLTEGYFGIGPHGQEHSYFRTDDFTSCSDSNLHRVSTVRIALDS